MIKRKEILPEARDVLHLEPLFVRMVLVLMMECGGDRVVSVNNNSQCNNNKQREKKLT